MICKNSAKIIKPKNLNLDFWGFSV